MDKRVTLGRRLAWSVGAVLLIIVFGELGARALLPRVIEMPEEGFAHEYWTDPRLGLLTWTEKYKAHPYFGYATQHILDFESEPRADDEFLVAVTGGSVASMLAYHLQTHPHLVANLNQVVGGSAQRPVRVVNLAMGGGKQPQQFFVTAYFAHRVDMIINVDGLNDAVPQSLLPVYPLEFPQLSLRFFDRTGRAGKFYALLGRVTVAIYKGINRVGRLPVVRNSYLYYGVWYTIHPYLNGLARRLEAAYFGAAVESAWPEGSDPPTDSELIAKRVEIWKRFAIQQADFAATVPVYLFLQPNQHVKGSKPLSTEELEFAIDRVNQPIYSEAMARLRRATADLSARGVPIYDLTGIFSQVEETVYKDNCCHLNRLGNDILGRSIVGIITQPGTQESGGLARVRRFEAHAQ